LYPVQQYVGEQDITAVTLNIHYKTGQETSYLYEDDKESFEYENGAYRLSEFTLTGEQNQISIEQSLSGDYQPKIQHYVLKLIGLPFKVGQIMIDGVHQEATDGVHIKADFRELVLTE